MSYQLAGVSGDIRSEETWDRLAKFVVVHVVVGIIMSIVILLVTPMMAEISDWLSIGFLVGVILVGNAYMLSWYENWRGCHFEQK